MMANSGKIWFLPHKRIVFLFVPDTIEYNLDAENDNDDTVMDSVHSDTIQNQIKALLASLFHQIELGY